MLSNQPLGEVVQRVTREVKHSAELAAVRGREIVAQLREKPELHALIQNLSGEADRNALAEAGATRARTFTNMPRSADRAGSPPRCAVSATSPGSKGY